MAVDVGTLVMKFEADDKKLQKGFASISKGVKNIAKVTAVAAAAVSAALVGVAVKSIKLAAEQEKAEARLESIAKKVTKATDAQVESLKKLAAETQKVSTFGDDVLITGQSQLLSFGLQTEQVEQLTGSFADLLAANKGITATSEDAINAANLLGKAFSGQAGALSRVGILLNDTQAEILKNGTAAEKTAALVRIMDQNYGGLAETLSKTTEGQLKQAQNAIGDIAEKLGSVFLPIVNKTLDVVQSNLPQIEAFFTGTFDTIEKAIKVTVDFIQDKVIPIFQFLFKDTEDGLDSFKTFWMNTFNAVVEVSKKAWEFFKTNLLPGLIEIFEFVKANIPAIQEVFTRVFNKVVEVGTVLFDFFKKNILPIFIEMFNFVVENMPLFKEIFGRVFDAVFKVVEKVWTIFKERFLPTLEIIYQFILKNMPTIKAIFKTTFEIIVGIIEVASLVIVTLIDTIFNLWDTVKEVFGNIGSAVTSGFDIVKSSVESIIGVFNGVISVVSGAIDTIKSFFRAKDSGDFSLPSFDTNLGNIVSGQRAFGGNVTAGNSFLVGERGKEMFTPSTNGTITPASAGNITINVNGAQDANLIGNEIVRILNMQGIARAV